MSPFGARSECPVYSKADSARLMMGWTPPTALMCQGGGVEHHLREGSVSEAIIIGLDIAKYVFHAHGVDGRGRAIFSKRITRRKLLDFFVAQPSCTVALEACGGAHHWARLLTQLGHEVRLIWPAYVKPFVKRQKNDAIDAEAICEGRDFAAWLGLTPLQRSTGGKQKLGATSKMGERTLRRLLIIGSSAVVQQAIKRGAPKGSWLEQMLTRKPRMLVTVALANKMARIVWALLVKRENYRAPVAATA